MRSLHASPVLPRLVAEVEPGLVLFEWIEGRTLARLGPEEPLDAAALGRALAILHATPAPKGVPRISADVAALGWRDLPFELSPMARELGRAIEARPLEEDVFLHADLVPSNIVLARGGPRFIDPGCRLGPRAWDLAQVAASCLGHARSGVLGLLLEGYGTTPPLLAETFT